MFDSKTSCQNCKGCCKFHKDDLYFAPVFSTEELNLIGSKGYALDSFVSHKNSRNVFQITLIEKEGTEEYYVCPYLNREKHLCEIYNMRPIDCKIWPLIVMRDKNNGKVVLAYSKSSCEITDQLDASKFEMYQKNLLSRLDRMNFIEIFKKYPDLIWEYEPETIIIRELHIG